MLELQVRAEGARVSDYEVSLELVPGPRPRTGLGGIVTLETMLELLPRIRFKFKEVPKK